MILKIGYNNQVTLKLKKIRQCIIVRVKLYGFLSAKYIVYIRVNNKTATRIQWTPVVALFWCNFTDEMLKNHIYTTLYVWYNNSVEKGSTIFYLLILSYIALVIFRFFA